MFNQLQPPRANQNKIEIFNQRMKKYKSKQLSLKPPEIADDQYRQTFSNLCEKIRHLQIQTSNLSKELQDSNDRLQEAQAYAGKLEQALEQIYSSLDIKLSCKFDQLCKSNVLVLQNILDLQACKMFVQQVKRGLEEIVPMADFQDLKGLGVRFEGQVRRICKERKYIQKVQKMV